MAQTQTPPAAPEMDSAIQLFDLFREYELVPIIDPRGRSITMAVQALNSEDNAAMQEALAETRNEAARYFEKKRPEILDEVQKQKHEDIVKFVLALEEGTAMANVDLAPGYDPNAENADAVVKESIEQWRIQRAKELEDPKVAVATAVERHIGIAVRARSTHQTLDRILCLMVYGTRKDPLTGEIVPTSRRALSMDPKEPNYIGKLMPQTREALLQARIGFLNKRTEQAVRQTTQDPAFLPSGESPKPSDDSPGATSETQLSFPPTSPSSTPSANG